MNRTWVCLFVGLTLTGPGLAQPEPVRLTIRPTPASTPALRYHLLPEVKDQSPGNALLLYYRAFSPEWHGILRRPEVTEKLGKWKENRHQVPDPSLKSVANTVALKEVDLAARREYCNWEMTPRLRQEGIGLLLPDVQGFRVLADFLAARARFELAEGRFDKANETLQTGLAMSRHLADAPVLIHALVGMAVATMFLDQTEVWIQTPGSPNLYWPLTDLPRPFIGLRKAYQGEKLWIEGTFPELRDLETAPLTPAQQAAFLTHMKQLAETPGSPFEDRLRLIALTVRVYPRAKQFLIDQGRKPETVEALPALQVVLLYSFHQYRRLQDESCKLFNLPYWEAMPRLREAEQLVYQAKKTGEEGLPLASLMLPAVQRVQFRQAWLDRRVALLRCIEAIRLHAAAHQGQLPAALADIKEVPIPIDPVTGRGFDYLCEGNRAILSAPPPLGEKPAANNSLRYELTLTR